MSDLPFELVDESALDANSIKALEAATGMFKEAFKGAGDNFIDPDIDAAFKHVNPVIDQEYLAIHRVRLATRNAPMFIFSYVTFFGDREALRSLGYDPMDEYPCSVPIEIRKGFTVIHVICPIAMLHSNVFCDLVMSDWSQPMTTTTTPFHISSVDDESTLSEFETNLMIELN